MRSATKILIRTTGLAAVIVATVTATASYLLSKGPVSLGFLSPFVESALSNTGAGITVKFEDTVLTWAGWRRTLEIRVTGARIIDAEGVVLATVPEMSLALSGWALVRGKLAPTRIGLMGVRARMVRRLDGSFAFGFGGSPSPGEDPHEGRPEADDDSVLLALAQQLLEPPDSGRSLGFLRQVSITNADLTIFDRPSQTMWRVPGAHLTLTRDERGISGDLAGDILVGSRKWSLNVTGIYDNGEAMAHLAVYFGDIVPAMLASQGEIFAPLRGLALPVSGTLNMDVGLKGASSTVDFDITTGAGFLVLPDQLQAVVPIDRVTASGRFEQDKGLLTIDELFVQSGPTRLSAAGEVFAGEDGFGAKLEAEISNIPGDGLAQFWPLERAKATRDWFVKNVRGGEIGLVNVKLDIPRGAIAAKALPEDAVDMSFDFAGARLRYMRQMPWATGVSGHGRMNASTLTVNVEEAHVGNLEISETVAVIRGINGPHQTAEIDVVVKGTAADSLALINTPPLSLADKMGTDPQAVGGEAASRLKFTYRVKRGLTMKDISFAAAVNVRDLSMPTFVKGLNITAGDILITANGSGLSAEGRIDLNGVPVDAVWRKEFYGQGDSDGRFVFSGLLDDEARAALNIRTAEYVQGPVDGELILETKGRRIVRGEGSIDLTSAMVAVPSIFWRKPAGQEGKLEFILRPREGGGLVAEEFEVTAEAFKAVGKVEFNSEMEIRSIDLGRLEFGRTNVSLGVLRTPDGGWEVSGGGQVYDLRPAISGIFGASSKAGAAVKLSARVERVILGDGQELRGVIIDFYHTGEYWREAAVDGTFPDGSPFRLRVTPKGPIRTLTILSDNAGSVSRGLQVFPGTLGGSLLVTAVMDDQSPGRPTIGTIVARDFKLVRAPVLAKLLAAVGSLTGLSDVLAGEGIAFKKLTGSFSLENSVLRLEKVRAAGSALGLTIDGHLNLATRAAGFGGELVPAYSINTAISKVPLLGQLLAGGKGRGVFAFTYKMEGPLDDLKVTVNPLAALTPGILRRIMSVLDGSARPVASPPPEPAALAESDLDDELEAPSADEWLPQSEEVLGLPEGSEPQDAPDPEFMPQPEIAARPKNLAGNPGS